MDQAIDGESELSRALAAMTVRRKCNQHACVDGPSCQHPNHRRDVDYMEECLLALGLPGKYPE